MFAYCLNNPVCLKDDSGSVPTEAIDTDGDGDVDYYRYEYTFVYVTLIFDYVQTEIRTGCAYIYPDIGSPKNLDSSDIPEGFNPQNDIMIGYYVDTKNGHDNPVLYAYQTQIINAGAYRGVINSMIQFDEDFSLGWERSEESLLTEWISHLILLGKLGYSRTANVDFDKESEEFTFLDYLGLAIEEVIGG